MKYFKRVSVMTLASIAALTTFAGTSSAELAGYVGIDGNQKVYEYEVNELNTSWTAYSRDRAGKELAVDLVAKTMDSLLDSNKGYVNITAVNDAYLEAYNEWRRNGKVGTIQFDLNTFLASATPEQIKTYNKIFLSELESGVVTRVDKSIVSSVPTLANQFASVERTGATFTATVKLGQENEKLELATTLSAITAVGIPEKVIINSTEVVIGSEISTENINNVKNALATLTGKSFSEITMNDLKGRSIQLLKDGITYTFTVVQ